MIAEKAADMIKAAARRAVTAAAITVPDYHSDRERQR